MTHMLSGLAGGRLVVALEVNNIHLPDASNRSLIYKITNREVTTWILYQILRWQLQRSSLVKLLINYLP